MNTQAQAEMPKYESHKIVHALKIENLVINHNGSIDLFFESPFSPINLERDVLKNKPTPQIGFYYVVYKGGYFSFSPSDAFEAGYTRMITTGE